MHRIFGPLLVAFAALTALVANVRVRPPTAHVAVAQAQTTDTVVPQPPPAPPDAGVIAPQVLKTAAPHEGTAHAHTKR